MSATTIAGVLPYTVAPVVAAIIGAAVTAWRRPPPTLQSFVQHFAAGVIFAAAAAELLPDVVHGRSFGATLVGAAVGVALMLTIRFASRKAEGAVSLTAVVGVDVLVDGLVVSLGFIQGQSAGLLLTIALTIELLFLGLSISTELGEGETSKARIVGTTAGVALLLPVGATIGAAALAGLSGNILTAIYAFGLVALLYLVTEELLVEAHEKPDTALNTGVFFVGFFLMVVLDELLK